MKADETLKKLLTEAKQLAWDENCPECYQNKMCCDSCNIIVKGRPIHFMSISDLYEMCEFQNIMEEND